MSPDDCEAGNLMSPDNCEGPLTTDNVFDDNGFVSICKQKHEHSQHLMRNMEESHDAVGNRHKA